MLVAGTQRTNDGRRECSLSRSQGVVVVVVCERMLLGKVRRMTVTYLIDTKDTQAMGSKHFIVLRRGKVSAWKIDWDPNVLSGLSNLVLLIAMRPRVNHTEAVAILIDRLSIPRSQSIAFVLE